MAATVLIGCIISSSDYSANLGLEVWFDDELILDLNPVKQAEHVEFSIADADAEHELAFVLKNKLDQHTRIDAAGAIIQDATVTISNVEFDGIPLGQVLIDLAQYQHNLNGHGSESSDRFYGEMGCNGRASLKFTTPIYMWMLDHM